MKQRGRISGTRATVGAYYFEGWAGRNALADDPTQPWAKDAPAHVTRQLVEEFPEREPVWGWRDDSLEIMERQIDLAADHGIAFFAFCWYWHDNGQAINKTAIQEDFKHLCLDLFLKARNSHRMKFCLLVANHEGSEIKGVANWKAAGEFWLPYLTHPQYQTVGGKPLLIIFNSKGGDRDGFAAMQESACKAGLPGLAIAGSWGGAPEDGYVHRQHNVAMDDGYTHRTHYNIVPGWARGLESHTYAELAAANRAEWHGSPGQPYMPIVTAGWDKRPWENPADPSQKGCWYHPDRTPEQVAACLRDAVAWMDHHPDQTTAERIVLVYAWNEFGEGGHIAPTKGDPEGKYLKALKDVVYKSKVQGAAQNEAV